MKLIRKIALGLASITLACAPVLAQFTPGQVLTAAQRDEQFSPQFPLAVARLLVR